MGWVCQENSDKFPQQINEYKTVYEGLTKRRKVRENGFAFPGGGA